MGFLDRLFGRDDHDAHAPRSVRQSGQASSFRDAGGRYAPPPAAGVDAPADVSGEDRQAIERYRYLLRTAPPETIEQVHAEAFAKLTDAQRQRVLADLSSTLPPSERPTSDDPRSMARAATRAEYTQPGFMERTFGGRSFGGTGGGFGATVGASILGTIGGYVIGSALVSAFLAPAFAADGAGSDQDPAGESGANDAGAAGADGGGDPGGFGDFGGFGGFGGFDGF